MAIDRIENFLSRCKASSESALLTKAVSAAPEWKSIQLRDVSFCYDSQKAGNYFVLKNIDLSIARGSTVFIVGANGSGKTTLAKILLGLYAPTDGAVSLDQTRITSSNLLSYRALFDAVFSDAHLFRRRATQLIQRNESLIHSLLNRMKLTLSLSDDDRIDVKPYSQGQKKRLASAFTLANNKSICLFDEWTADQDPEFRHYFYYELLPQMKSAGKTLLVITHDDRYFHLADSVVKLRDGEIVERLDQSQDKHPGARQVPDLEVQPDS